MTEQELIEDIFPNDNTKTINDVIDLISERAFISKEKIKEILKLNNPDIEWSF